MKELITISRHLRIPVILPVIVALSQPIQSHAFESIEEFVPCWAAGDSWNLRISSMAMQRVHPTRTEWKAVATVVGTPNDEIDYWVVSIVVEQDRECVFLALDGQDLSLRELREANIRDLPQPEIQERSTSWQRAERHLDFPGGVPAEISTAFIRMGIPVLCDTVAPNSQPWGLCIQRSEIISSQEQSRLKVLISRERDLQSATEALDRNEPLYELTWDKGKPWWSSCVRASEDEYRIDLIDP